MSEASATADARHDREPPPFAHASEAELARILDFYDVRWEYEPHTYPILWSLDGAVVESFAPDFYLPDLDLYVELTTLRQRLVRKKNRKLRRLRELYPDIRIKLFYARDFRALMLKYGKLAIVDELSGTVGQVVPVRIGEDRGPSAGTPAVDGGVDRADAGRSGSAELQVAPIPTVAPRAGPGARAATAATGSSPNESRSPRSRRKREAPAR